ncbi:MAG: hypothetical protein ABW161_19045, partial [Candidatus Thiodiazotropha sp.]
MRDLQDLELIISSGTSILFIESDDERQVETLFERLAAQLGRQLLRWTVASGLTRMFHPFLNLAGDMAKLGWFALTGNQTSI